MAKKDDHSDAEKKRFYSSRVNDSKLTEGQRQYAKQRLAELKSGNGSTKSASPSSSGSAAKGDGVTICAVVRTSKNGVPYVKSYIDKTK